MVFCLGANLQDSQRAVSVADGLSDYLEELGLAHVIRTGAGDQGATGTQHPEGAQVQFFIAAKGSVEVALALGEGWRIENDGVVLVAGGGMVTQQVESIGFNPLDFTLIEDGILFGGLQSRAGTVYPSNFGTARRQVQGKAALVTEHIQGFPRGVLRGGGIVFALIKKGAGFLSLQSCIVKADAVHGIHGAGLFPDEKARGTRRKLLKSQHPLVHPFQYRGWFEQFGQGGSDRHSYTVGVHGLGEHLEGKNVVVTINNQTRQEIALAKDDAIGIGILDEFLAVRNSGGNSLLEQGCEIADRLMGKHADRDLRGTAIERGA